MWSVWLGLSWYNKKAVDIEKVYTTCFLVYPALMGSKTPTSKFSGSKEVRWGPLIKVSLYKNTIQQRF